MLSRSIHLPLRRLPYIKGHGLRPTVNYTTTKPTFDASWTWNEPHEADRASYPPEDVFRGGVRHHHRCNTAFPLNHRTTIAPYRVPRTRSRKEIKETLVNAFGKHDALMLYVHVPFCNTRCQFCEYTVIDPKIGRTADAQSAYFDALMNEFRQYDDLLDTNRKTLAGFDIGGGTPSMASIGDIDRIMNAAAKHFNLQTDRIEVSIETTPKIAATEPEKLRAYYDMGIRRISMGLQTSDFRQAKVLGRLDANDGIGVVHRAVENVRAAGFQSFNVDLMYGFPRPKSSVQRSGDGGGHIDEPWMRTVRDAIELGPEHITLYRMRYKGTSMEHLAGRVSLAQVNEQEGLARRILTGAGYSGMIGKNTYSKQNGSSGCSDYLDRRVVRAVPYIGLGLGAQSFSHHTLSYNLGAVTKSLQLYLAAAALDRIPIQDIYHLGKRAAIAKMVAVSFYYGGIDLRAFESVFHEPLEAIFQPEIDFLVANGLMVYEDGADGDRRLQMTTLGKEHFGGVVALFYSPSVQKYVINLPGGEEFPRDPLDVIREKRAASTASQTAASSNQRQSWAFDAASKTWVEVPDASVAKAMAAMQAASASASASANNASSVANKNSGVVDGSNNSCGEYEFGNILFGGNCNQRCPFCIGKQLNPSLTTDNLRQWPPTGIDEFFERMRASRTQRVILTGTRTDPQLYRHESLLVDTIRDALPGVHIALHTNGIMALNKMDVFNKYDSVTISVNSFDAETFSKLHGTRAMPDLAAIVAQSRVPIKLSCVVTEDNVHQLESYVATAAKLGITRIAFRYLFNESKRWPHIPLFERHQPTRYFCGNPVYMLRYKNGSGADVDVEVTHWVFENNTRKSLNLFSDGTISEHYLLAKAPTNQITDHASLTQSVAVQSAAATDAQQNQQL